MLDVLAIAAHPDDVEQTCGGTLLRMAEAGYRTGIIDLTAGDMGTRGSPEIRVAESEAAAAILRVSHRENLHFPDARLENSMAGRMTLAHRIRELRPAYRDPAVLGRAASRPLPRLRDRLRSLLPGGTAKDRPVHRTAPAVQNHLLLDLRERDADVRGGYYQLLRTPHGVSARLPFAIRTGGGSEPRCFPTKQEIRDRLAAIARFYGNLIGVKYGEPFVVKETMRIDDIVSLPVRSI